mmetsp:Transcript_60978/g.163554  ORF Transcript_60978/g.163554 Transcript_60978/m.163554 type:complete len:376 (-) Transcript_60978:376-1503(-)
MHEVPELMKISLNIAVLQQGRLVRAGRGEIAHDGRHRELVPARGPGRFAAGLEPKASGVSVLALAGMHVHIEPPHRLLRLRIGDSKRLHVIVPLLQGTVGGEHQSQQLLVDPEQSLRHDLHREILLQLLVVHLVPILLQHMRTPPLVPGVDLPVEGLAALLALRFLDLQQGRHVRLHEGVQLAGQVAEEITDGWLGLGHASLHNEGTVSVIPQQASLLVAQLHELLENLRVLRRAPAVELKLHPPPGLRHTALLHHREIVRVLECHQVLVPVSLQLLQPVLGAPLQLLGREGVLALLLPEVLGERDAELGDALVDGLNPRSLLLSQIQPLPTEVPQDPLHQPVLLRRQLARLQAGRRLGQGLIYVLATAGFDIVG